MWSHVSLYERSRERLYKQKRRHGNHKNRDSNDAASNSGMPVAARAENGERKRQRVPTLLRTPLIWLLKLISDFWPPELSGIHFHHFETKVCGDLLQQLQEADTTSKSCV